MHLQEQTHTDCGSRLGAAQIQADRVPEEEMGMGSQVTKKLSVIGTHLQRKNYFAPITSHWV